MKYDEGLKKKIECTHQSADAENHSGSFHVCCGTGTVFCDGYTDGYFFNNYYVQWY
jgi:hypothetical protein